MLKFPIACTEEQIQNLNKDLHLLVDCNFTVDEIVELYPNEWKITVKSIVDNFYKIKNDDIIDEEWVKVDKSN